MWRVVGAGRIIAQLAYGISQMANFMGFVAKTEAANPMMFRTYFFLDRIDISSETLASMNTSGLPTRLMTNGQWGVFAGMKK